MSKALVIRADANTRMGTGHVMRCIALGQAWQDAGGTVTFISCCDAAAIHRRVRDEGFALHHLATAHPQSDKDLRTTLEVVRDTAAAWLVTDGYHFDLDYQRAVRSAGVKLLCVDDYAHLDRYEADILLNQNVSAHDFTYTRNAGCTMLLGTQFAMLRREFTRFQPKPNAQEFVRNTLISMGGSDPDNTTLAVLRALSGLPDAESLRFRAVIGPSNPHAEILQAEAECMGLRIELLSSVKSMPSLIQWAHIAVTAAGSTCWELAYLGTPFLVLVLSDNQVCVARGLGDCQVSVNLGWYGPEKTETLKKQFARMLSSQDLRNTLSARGQKLVDGRFAERILHAMEEA